MIPTWTVELKESVIDDLRALGVRSSLVTHHFARKYIVKYQVRLVTATKDRPSGIKYSFTLHDPKGKRIYGIDNAHKAGRRREFDHRHPHRPTRLVAYEDRGPVPLLEYFLREVERILTERGVL